MHEALAELAAGAIRPVLADAVASLERIGVLLAILVGFGLLVVAATIGLITAGALALVPAVGPAGAVGIGAGSLLVISIVGVLLTRRALLTRADHARRTTETQTEAAKSGAAQPAPAATATKGPVVDPTLVVAACATATIILGPSRMLRAVRGTLDVIRLGASLMAGAELVKSLDLIAHVFRREGPMNAESAAAGSTASGAAPA